MLQNTFGFFFNEAERPSPDPQALGGAEHKTLQIKFHVTGLDDMRQLPLPSGQIPQPPCGAIQPCCSPGPSPLQVALHCPCGTSFHSGGWTLPCFPTQHSHPHFSAFSEVSPLIPACSLKLKAMG